jgi:hypothetical protein
MTQYPSQPLRHARSVLNSLEFIMKNHEPSRWVDLLELFLAAANGVFPGPALERLIDRVEGLA